MSADTEPLLVHFVAYESDADIDVEYDEGGDPVIQNHDELVNSGDTYDEITALADTESNREYIAEHQIIEPGDPLWDEQLADFEVGDSIRVDELRE